MIKIGYYPLAHLRRVVYGRRRVVEGWRGGGCTWVSPPQRKGDKETPALPNSSCNTSRCIHEYMYL